MTPEKNEKDFHFNFIRVRLISRQRFIADGMGQSWWTQCSLTQAMNLANSLLPMIKQADRQNEEHPSAEKFHFLKLDLF